MTPGNLQVSLEKVLNPTGHLIWQIRGGPDSYALFLLKKRAFWFLLNLRPTELLEINYSRRKC
ncbi:hypothetical protein LD39_16535 [Halobacillus sp. BBL2006]|nr:hypothetical protein LD39_16535 [Halobacillus sp. BBL2006]